MHDARFKSLMEVLNHYSDGVKDSPTLAAPLKSAASWALPHPWQKTIAHCFLGTLTDHEPISDPDFEPSTAFRLLSLWLNPINMRHLIFAFWWPLPQPDGATNPQDLLFYPAPYNLWCPLNPISMPKPWKSTIPNTTRRMSTTSIRHWQEPVWSHALTDIIMRAERAGAAIR